MPKYYCDYCDVFLTHDSTSVRKTHNGGRKHKDNVRAYYQAWLEDQAQKLIDNYTKMYLQQKVETAKMYLQQRFPNQGASEIPLPAGPPNYEAYQQPVMPSGAATPILPQEQIPMQWNGIQAHPILAYQPKYEPSG